MTYVPPPFVATGPGVPQLLAALTRLHQLVTECLRLRPEDWRSPAADAYCDTVMELAGEVRTSAARVDEALAAARHHADQLDYLRAALAGTGVEIG